MLIPNKEEQYQRVKLLNVGYGNYVVAHRVVAILESGPLPTRKLRERALEKGFLVDATQGKKMRSVIVMDSNHIIISGLTSQTLHERLAHTEMTTGLSKSLFEIEEGELVS